MNAKVWISNLAVGSATALTLFCGSVRAQVTQQQIQQRAARPNPATNVLAYSGKISGVVYWDTTKVVRNTEATLINLANKTTTTVPVAPGCDGTAVYVWITDQTAQWGAWQTATSTFNYSMNGSSAICAYTIDHVPVGQALSVAAYVPSEDYSFKTGTTEYGDMAAVPAPGDKATWWYTWGGGVGGVGASVTVVSTPCRDFVSFSSPTSLVSGPRSCGGQAANVNFVVGSYSDYMTNLFAATFGSQQLSASQASRVPLAVRTRQTASSALTAQSASSTKTATGGQIASSTANQRLASTGGTQNSGSTATPRPINAAAPQAPMLGSPAQPLLAHGGTPGALMEQAPGTTNAAMASGSPASAPAARAAVAPAKVTPPSGGPQTGPAAIPSKGHEKNGYEAVTTQRGATSDPNFTKWTNPANRYTVPPNATNICLNKAFIRSVNGKAAPQIPFVGGSDGEGTVIGGVVSASITFTPGKHYIISGCGFGTIAGKVYLLGQFPAHGGKIMLEPYHASAISLRSLSWGSQWSDRQIDAQIDPSLSGEVSQPGIALIIETSTGAKLQAFGFSFSP